MGLRKSVKNPTADVTSPFKATISRWVCPDVTRNQNISVSKAKKAISD